MFRSGIAIMAALVVTGALFVPGVVQLRYPRVVENDPLIAPVFVASVDGNTLELDDGRRITIDSTGSIEEAIANSDFRVDIESLGGDTVVYVKERGWICGTPWTGLISIPIIPDDVPINHRSLLGISYTSTNP